MTQANRSEPTFTTVQGASTSSSSTLVSLFGLGKKKEQVSHTDILKDALQFATDAQTKLDEAHDVISKQIDEHRDQATFHQNKAVEAGESLSRLERVKARFVDLLA